MPPYGPALLHGLTGPFSILNFAEPFRCRGYVAFCVRICSALRLAISTTSLGTEYKDSLHRSRNWSIETVKCRTDKAALHTISGLAPIPIWWSSQDLTLCLTSQKGLWTLRHHWYINFGVCHCKKSTVIVACGFCIFSMCGYYISRWV